MMITEDEAKTKWCPFARMLTHISAQDGHGRTFEGGYSYNRSPNGNEGYLPIGCKCIGSACMAWRKTDVLLKTEVPDGYSKLVTYRTVVKGYCGLAGKSA